MRSSSRRAHFSLIAIGASALIALTGCSGGGSGSTADLEAGDPHAPELTEVSVAGILGPGPAAAWAAQESGIAAEYGLTIDPMWVDSSAVSTTAVVSGEAAASIASYFGVIDAINQGLALSVVAEAYASSPDAAMLIALPDSGIESVEDLPGKTVNVLSLNSSHAVKIKDQLQELGLDPESVNFVELPYGEVPAALEQGTVDASSAVGTALQTSVEELGAEVVFDYGAEPYEGMAESGFIMSNDFISSNPNTTAALQCALTRATQALIDDRELYEQFLSEELGMGAEAIAVDVPVAYEPTLRLDQLQRNADLYYETGYLDSEMDLTQYALPIPDNC
ncbi:MAG: ABC transporter substrate-binding protein [Pseudoclavibacter sp.]